MSFEELFKKVEENPLYWKELYELTQEHYEGREKTKNLILFVSLIITAAMFFLGGILWGIYVTEQDFSKDTKIISKTYVEKEWIVTVIHDNHWYVLRPRFEIGHKRYYTPPMAHHPDCPCGEGGDKQLRK